MPDMTEADVRRIVNAELTGRVKRARDQVCEIEKATGNFLSLPFWLVIDGTLRALAEPAPDAKDDPPPGGQNAADYIKRVQQAHENTANSTWRFGPPVPNMLAGRKIEICTARERANQALLDAEQRRREYAEKEAAIPSVGETDDLKVNVEPETLIDAKQKLRSQPAATWRERVEAGDRVRDSANRLAEVLGIFGAQALVSGLDGQYMIDIASLHLDTDGKRPDRPDRPDRPGDGFRHRLHPEWGMGVWVTNRPCPRAIFPAAALHETNRDLLDRIACVEDK